MTHLLIALWAVGSVALLIIALRDWPPAPRSFDEHADDALRLVRHRQVMSDETTPAAPTATPPPVQTPSKVDHSIKKVPNTRGVRR